MVTAPIFGSDNLLLVVISATTEASMVCDVTCDATEILCDTTEICDATEILCDAKGVCDATDICDATEKCDADGTLSGTAESAMVLSIQLSLIPLLVIISDDGLSDMLFMSEAAVSNDDTL